MTLAAFAVFLFAMTASGLPRGLSLRSETTQRRWWVDGTPDPQSLGSHTATMTAASSGALAITHTFIWTIGTHTVHQSFSWDTIRNDAPTLVPPANRVSDADDPIAFQLQSVDLNGDARTCRLMTTA